MDGETAVWRPRPRLVEVLPASVDGRALYALRDPLEPAAPALCVPREALLLLSLMDGERDLPRLCSAFALRTGQVIPLGQVEAFVRRLDDAHLLFGPRFDARLDTLRADFRAAPHRAATHAGGAYPDEPSLLAATLDAHFRHAEGPGDLHATPGDRELVGLIAPHVDLHRGGPTYAWAYKALAQAASPELIVLLGTCHAPMATPFAATAKDYDTPLGPLATDAAFVRDLAARYSGDLFADEFAHRAEHALEFQAVYLRYLQLRGFLGGVQVVPILCGSPHALVPPSPTPTDEPRVAELLMALAERLAADPRRACIIAGADLAHVGPQFGDPEPVTRPLLTAVGDADRAMLMLAVAGDAEGFYRNVIADGDRRRICGVAPMYGLLRLLPPVRGEVLRYTPWADPAGYSAVTFASVAYYRA